MQSKGPTAHPRRFLHLCLSESVSMKLQKNEPQLVEARLGWQAASGDARFESGNRGRFRRQDVVSPHAPVAPRTQTCRCRRSDQ